MRSPTQRQHEIAAYLEAEICQHGVMPSRRQIADQFGFSSPNAAQSHLRLMEKKGMITRWPRKARGLKLKRIDSSGIPLLGDIAAGQPQIALENADEVIHVTPKMFSGSNLFALRVKGDSMKDEGILHGDIAVLNQQQNVNNGEIAAVLLNEEATLKFVIHGPGTIVLRGANAAFPDIIIKNTEADSLRVVGKYVGMIRKQGGAF